MNKNKGTTIKDSAGREVMEGDRIRWGKWKFLVHWPEGESGFWAQPEGSKDRGMYLAGLLRNSEDWEIL